MNPIDWLLGGATAVGIAGVVVLAIYLAKQAGRNRMDLLAQIKLTSSLADERIARAALEHAMGDLNDVLSAQTDDLARERAATASLRDSLNHAFEEMAKSGTATGAVVALRGALDRLSKLPSVPATRATTDRDGEGGVHGATPGPDHGDGGKDRDP